MKTKKTLKEMNTLAHRMASDIVLELEELIKQTEQNAQLGRKLRVETEEESDVDYTEALYTLSAANRHLKLARELLAALDEDMRNA
jgi:hypothetical protein